MYSISFDIDWVCDEVLQHCIDILDEHQVKATFFATHTSPLISKLESLGHEVGLHPNFLPTLKGDCSSFQEIIESLVEIFPDAVGIRTHCLITGSPIIQYYSKLGISYDASNCPWDIPPFMDYGGIVDTLFFSDLQTVIDGGNFVYNQSQQATEKIMCGHFIQFTFF